MGATSDENLYEKTTSTPNNDNHSNNSPLSNANPNSNKNTSTSKSNNQSSSTSEKPKLSALNRVRNTFIGATLGLAVGGGVVAIAGAAITVFAPWGVVAGVAGSQIFAIGAVAFNLEAMVFAPFYSVELDPIEWEQ